MDYELLLLNSEKYLGQYVALDSYKNRVVVCSGSDPALVFNRAKDKGIKDPIVFFVPEREMVHIY
jgi:hypothetical protein